jgi:hypothetical protein
VQTQESAMSARSRTWIRRIDLPGDANKSERLFVRAPYIKEMGSEIEPEKPGDGIT